VTGRLADGWIPSLGFAPPDRIPGLLDRIRTAAVAAGRPVDAVRAVYNVPVRLGGGSARDGEVAGTATAVVEQLIAFTALGFSGFNLQPEPGQAQAIAEQVLPALRAVR
jgi:alkanesulfonate monooxygenase SsuD/methylene tetrahydromethanopterin reductase-like flavin-dependent oxidoreductase (luciferase family)